MTFSFISRADSTQPIVQSSISIQEKHQCALAEFGYSVIAPNVFNHFNTRHSQKTKRLTDSNGEGANKVLSAVHLKKEQIKPFEVRFFLNQLQTNFLYPFHNFW
jgi:hypothetical protein